MKTRKQRIGMAIIAIITLTLTLAFFACSSDDDATTAAPPVDGAGPAIVTYSLPNGTEGTAYSQTLTSTGTPPLTWSVTGDGELPAGLSINAGTGVISGTPTTAGTSKFTIKAVTAAGTGTMGYSVTILKAGVPIITSGSLPAGTEGTAYSQTLTATGTSPITWSLVIGELPEGFTLNASTGVISGTPDWVTHSAVGQYLFYVKATNTQGSDTKQFLITIAKSEENTDEPPIISESSLPIGTAGVPYSAYLIATGDEPITWSVVGTLPPGLNLTHDTDRGVISGTPTTAGRYVFYVKAINAKGIDTKLSTIIIAAPGGYGSVPDVSSSLLTNGKVGTAFSYQLTTTGDATVTLSVDTGVLPAGLTINTGTGLISGTPTTAGTATFTVKAANLFGSITRQISITIIGD